MALEHLNIMSIDKKHCIFVKDGTETDSHVVILDNVGLSSDLELILLSICRQLITYGLLAFP